MKALYQCLGVNFKIVGREFRANFVVLDSKGINIILGKGWLSKVDVVIQYVLSFKTHRRATTGNTRSREASGTAGGPRSLGQRPSDLARTLAWSC
jgi:hypothetical protein